MFWLLIVYLSSDFTSHIRMYFAVSRKFKMPFLYKIENWKNWFWFLSIYDNLNSAVGVLCCVYVRVCLCVSVRVCVCACVSESLCLCVWVCHCVWLSVSELVYFCFSCFGLFLLFLFWCVCRCVWARVCMCACDLVLVLSVYDIFDSSILSRIMTFIQI